MKRFVHRAFPVIVFALWFAPSWQTRDARGQLPAISAHRFPDFNVNYVPPEKDYDKPLFCLSQDYPIKRPENDEPLKKILAIPFDRNVREANWEKYLLAVREYCFAGNLEVNWRGQDNAIRKWYHVPWQHWGEKGREGINGFTREATAQPKQLSPTQLSRFETHAVALYNPIGQRCEAFRGERIGVSRI